MRFHQKDNKKLRKKKIERRALCLDLKNRDKNPTIDINDAGTMTNKSIWCLEDIIEANTQTNFLNHLII